MTTGLILEQVTSNIQSPINEYAELSNDAYDKNLISKAKAEAEPENIYSIKTINNDVWHVLLTKDSAVDSMQAVAYGKYNEVTGKYDEIVVAYRGTNFKDPRDIFVDSQIALHLTPGQISSAAKFYNNDLMDYINNHQDEYSDNLNITLTGHSLGGALAQLIAAKYNLSKTNILPFFINKNLKIITDSDITDFYNFCISRGLSPRRTKNTLALLKQLLMYCKNRGWIKTCCNFQVKWLTSKNEFSMNRIIFEGD